MSRDKSHLSTEVLVSADFPRELKLGTPGNSRTRGGEESSGTADQEGSGRSGSHFIWAPEGKEKLATLSFADYELLFDLPRTDPRDKVKMAPMLARRPDKCPSSGHGR